MPIFTHNSVWCLGTYEALDFLALLVGYAISGERTLADFFERLAPFGPAFMALFGRTNLPHRASALSFPGRCGSSLSRSLPHALRATALRRGWTAETIGGIFDRKGRGNGDYHGELASARHSITTYLKHFAFLPEMALLRLDGQYGTATVLPHLIEAGVVFVTRGRSYQLVEYSQIQRVLAHPPTASVTKRNSGEVVELFDADWLDLEEGSLTSCA